MDHVVYVDAKAGEYADLISGKKTMIIRGATGRKIPYGRVNEGDMLYLIENDGSGVVKAKTKVSSVFNSEKMAKEDIEAFIEHLQDRGLKPNSVRTRLCALYAFVRFLIENKVLDYELLERKITVKLPARASRRPSRSFTEILEEQRAGHIGDRGQVRPSVQVA